MASASLVAGLTAYAVTPAAKASASSSGGTATYTATVNIPAPPASGFAGAATGDGWNVALTPTAVYNVFHHQEYLGVDCHLQANGAQTSPCWGGSVTITDTDGSAFFTSSQPTTFLDQSNGYLYVFATHPEDSTAGVVCMNTNAQLPASNIFCGYQPLTAAGQGPEDPSGISGVSDAVQVGSNMYAFNYVETGTPVGAEDQLMCFSLTTYTACPNQPFAVDTGLSGISVSSEPTPAIAAFSGEIEIPVADGGSTTLACYEPSVAGGSCGGNWPVQTGLDYGGNYGAAFPMLDSSAATTGFCLPTGSDPCYTLSGASTATPSGMTSSAVPANTGWNGPAVTIGPRVYVPDASSIAVYCFDYSADAECTNFPKAFSGINYGPYTVNTDPQRPTCIWVNSDSGSSQIQNFDAYSAGGCGEGPIRVFASGFVAPGAQCTPTQWTSLQITNPYPPSDYGGGSVEFENSDGGALAVSPNPADLDSTGSVDLTPYDFSTASDLPQFVLTLNSPPSDLSSVTMTASWQGQDSSSCVQSGTTISGGVTLTSPTTAAATGSNQTLTATVQSNSAPVNGATVDFTCTSGPCTTASGTATTNSSGIGTFTYSSTTPGTDIWTASYQPSGENLETSQPASVVWNFATSATPSTVVYGNPVTLAETGLPAAATGTVTFTAGGTTLCTAILPATSCATSSALAPGVYSVEASYPGDSNYPASSGQGTSFTVRPGSSTILTVDHPSAVVGQPVTATATISASPTSSSSPTAPTGRVDFQTSTDGGTTWTDSSCNGQPIAWSDTSNTGTATCALAFPAVTTGEDLRAVYSGDTNFSGSTSPTKVEVVNQASSQTDLAISPNPPVTGQPVTGTATVSVTSPGTGNPTAPTGTIDFQQSTDGGSTWVDTSCTAQPMSWSANTGTATCSLPAPASGEEFRAVYSGDTNFATSTSATADVAINPAATSTGLQVGPVPAVTGQPVDATATLSVTAPGSDSAVVPTGTVDFQQSTDGGSTWTDTTCNAQPISWNSTTHTGSATCSLPSAAVGSQELRAVYGGDGNFAGSTSPAQTSVVNPAATSTSLGLTPQSSVTGQAVAAAATITVNSPGSDNPTAPSGTVEFQYSVDGGTSWSDTTCTAVAVTWDSSVSHSGSADCSISGLSFPSGAEFRALYSGDDDFAASTSASQTETVTQAATAVGTVVEPTSVVTGQPVTAVATVTVSAPGSDSPFEPTGTVTFQQSTDGTDWSTIDSCSPADLDWNSASHSGDASCTVPYDTSSNGVQIRAVYSGDSRFAGQTSDPSDSVAVVPAGTATGLNVTPNPAGSGQQITATASVAVTAPGSDAPTAPGNDVTFEESTDNGTTFSPIDSCSDIALSWDGASHNGTATCSTSFGAASSGVQLEAVYLGDSNFNGSTSDPVALTVTQSATTTTSLTLVPNPAVSGQPVAATATVAIAAPGTDAPVAPTGTVDFESSRPGSGTFGSLPGCSGVTLVWNSTSHTGTAECPAAFDAQYSGTTVKAIYSGDTNFSGSTSTSRTAAVTPASTSTALQLAPQTTVSGQPSTATATVSVTGSGSDSPLAPTGSVLFQSSSDSGTTWTTIPGCTTASLVWGEGHTGTAACPLAYDAQSNGILIRASYSGDSDFTGSVSGSRTQTIGKDGTGTTLTSSPQPSTPAAAVTFTAKVKPTAPGAGSPTGTVTFTDGSATLCATVPMIAGQATCTAKLPVQPFTQTINAAYSGDGNFTSSVGHTNQSIQHGYWLVGSNGAVFNFGNAGNYGSTVDVKLNQPMVGIAATSDGRGYWTVASDGGVFTFGDAAFYGSTGNVHLNKPVIAITPTADGKGYYMVASDGGVFTFGDAHFYGSTGNVHLAAPIVGMVLSPDGGGYYLIGADGGVFTFGDARFHGSTAGSIPSGVTVVGLAPSHDLGGYWLALSDGQVMAFGDAHPYGSVSHPAKPIVGIAATADGNGYWAVGADGGVFNFGDAAFDGSAAQQQLAAPIVGMTDI